MLKDYLISKGLSNREAEVAELVAQGLPNKEVAEKLFVTEKTVKFHLTNIYKKMNVKSRAQLIVWCLPGMTMLEDQQIHANAVNAANPNTINNQFMGYMPQQPRHIHQNQPASINPFHNSMNSNAGMGQQNSMQKPMNETPTLFSGQQNGVRQNEVNDVPATSINTQQNINSNNSDQGSGGINN